MERVIKAPVLLSLLFIESLATCLWGLYMSYSVASYSVLNNFLFELFFTPELIVGLVSSLFFAFAGFYVGRLFRSTILIVLVSFFFCFCLASCFLFPFFSLFMWIY